MQNENILVWLPSPLGDAVLSTPALRAIREHFRSANISFFAKPVVRGVLSPCSFNDAWLEQKGNNPFTIAKMLKRYNFTLAILFKNSFASALACFLAGIPSRLGYAREGRGFLLTQKLYPQKLPGAKYKPVRMTDYYLAIPELLGSKAADQKLELPLEQKDFEELKVKLPGVANPDKTLVVIVPGGAFGPSKCWQSERFAQVADWLITNYNATVVISVSPVPAEKKIAEEICRLSKHKLINLAENPVSLGQLKSLMRVADLVITNDTGPRHIAIAFERKVITLFGPNDPTWTDTGYAKEIQIVGNVPCAPCARPTCKKSEHLCMQAITVKMVCDAAQKLLENYPQRTWGKPRQKFIKAGKSLFVDRDYEQALAKLGLTSIDAVFSFNADDNLAKKNLPAHRTRLKFKIDSPAATLFLKRYNKPPIFTQLRNWFSHHCRASHSFFDIYPADTLSTRGINTPKTIAYGSQWRLLFEKRSFCIIEEIANAESLERKLPTYFDAPPTVENLRQRRAFIIQLAKFVRKFHNTGFRHRDLYLSHIFYDKQGRFHLIDLARTFKPFVFQERFRIKDIAQIHYSAPARYFSRTDRLRFYTSLTGRTKLTTEDKTFIRKVIKKAIRIQKHDLRHGRTAPFAT